VFVSAESTFLVAALQACAIYDDNKGHFHLIWKVIASEFNISVYSKALEEVWKAKRFQMGELG